MEGLKERFEADAEIWDDDEHSKESIVAAFGYWTGYPFFLEMIGHCWHVDNTRAKAYGALNHVYRKATNFLMELAEKHGLDPHSLYEYARVVKEIYYHEPEKYYTGLDDTWPECMGTARYTLPAGQQEALRAGEGVYIRLAIKTGISLEKDAADVARKMNPQLLPPAQGRSEPMSLNELCSRYMNRAGVRADKVKPVLERFDLRREHPKKNLWTVSLDNMDKMTRDRMRRKP